MSNISENTVLSEYPEVLTARMVSKILALGYVKALNLIKYGGIRYIKIGNVYRVPKRSFVEWLNSEESREIRLDN